MELAMVSRRVRRLIQMTIALVLSFAARANAQARDSSTIAPRILGIYDAKTGAPIAGVQVRDGFSGDFAMSTTTGTVLLSFVTFRGVAAVVELKKLGYAPKRLYLDRDDNTPLTEVLEPVPTLAPMVTTEKYRLDRDLGQRDGFDTRCAAKNITCVRDSALVAHPLLNVADFLIQAPGVTIGSCGMAPGSGNGRRSAQCGHVAMHSLISADPYCQPTFYIDGYEWNSGAPIDLTPGQPAVAPFKPTNIKGIEVYLPEQSRPMRFAGNPNCGAVVMWTR
ncbi:MAG TPA: hypothetical protein VGM50_02695 [Gemmatimonadaceae bacterium]